MLFGQWFFAPWQSPVDPGGALGTTAPEVTPPDVAEAEPRAGRQALAEAVAPTGDEPAPPADPAPWKAIELVFETCPHLPMEGVEVSLHSVADSADVRVASSGADGVVLFSGLLGPRYEATLRLADMDVRVEGLVPGERRMLLTLSAGIAVEAVVMDEGRLPVVGATVDLRCVPRADQGDFEHQIIASRTAAADGRAAFRSLWTGRHHLSARKDGRAAAAGVGIEEGSFSRIELVLPAPLGIRGQVTDPSGAPVPGVLVKTFRSAATTGPDGCFLLGHFRSEWPLEIVYDASGFSRAIRWIDWKEFPEVDRDVIDIGTTVMERGCTLQLVVQNEGGKPLPEARAKAEAIRGTQRQAHLEDRYARADPEGRISFDHLAEGEVYWIEVTCEGYAWESAKITLVQDETLDVILVPGASLVVHLDGAAQRESIQGRVWFGASLQEMADSTLRQGGLNGQAMRMGAEAACIPGLLPGPCLVRLDGHGVARQYLSLVLEPGPNECTATVESGRAVRGRVVLPDGTVPTGARVDAQVVDWEAVEPGFDAFVADDGSFVLDGLPELPIKVWTHWRDEGRRYEAAEIVVIPDAAITLRLEEVDR